MNSDPEDDALSWEGDDALEARRPNPRRTEKHSSETSTSADVPAAAAPAPLPSGEKISAAGSPDALESDDEARAGIGTVSLVALGILGGVYLLFTVGWILGGVGMQSKAMFMLPGPLYQATLWIAVLAPALWFAATLLMTRGSKEWVRISALIIGALLLVPWPFVVAGGGAL